MAVLDVRLDDDPSGITGGEVCREVRWSHPEVACVMLTSFADDEAPFASIMAGAASYALKQIRGSDLVDAIRRIGEAMFLAEETVKKYVSHLLAELARQRRTDAAADAATLAERKRASP